ncbi:MAG: rRNA methyltransferase [Bacteroidetes bacterium]|nr:MAG: rRNA methyltransferase [Bacteroidota bacterium]
MFVADPLFHGGAYYVQEASSMFLEEVFNQVKSQIKSPLRVLDLCAAPGGKSTLLLSLLQDNDLLVANEIIKSRVNILQENIIKWGRSNVVVTNNDPEHFKGLKNYFDVIVVDAPCSGEGMFRKDKKAIDEWSEDHVKLCAIRQQRILADIMPALKPGGFIIYSTCTFNTTENEENVHWMSETFNLKPVQISLSKETGIVESQSWKNKDLFAYRFYLHKVKGEGFFIACLQKHHQPEYATIKIKEPKINKPSAAQMEAIKPWLHGDVLSFHLHQQTVYGYPTVLLNDMMYLQTVLNNRIAGLNIGDLVKGKLVPNHQLALSVHLNPNIQAIEVDKESALKFLKKEVFAPPVNLPQDIYLVKYKSVGLGWVKVMANRINNYLPINWRILKPLNELVAGG